MDENLFSKIWNIASVFRNDGMSDHLYLEQITNLLFLKMIDEQKNTPKALANELHDITLPDCSSTDNNGNTITFPCSWDTLRKEFVIDDDHTLLDTYTDMLDTLGQQSGILGEIYRNSRNEIPIEKSIKFVVKIIDKMTLSTQKEALGTVYEELMRRVSENTTSTNGQYFTPRQLIDAIVQCVNPKIGSPDGETLQDGTPENWKTVADPCCGTGGFLIAAKNYMEKSDPDKAKQSSISKLLSTSTFHGVEIERATYKLALMNMLLHNISGYDRLPIECKDSLQYSVNPKVDYVLTNPPFGKSGAVKVTVQKKDKKTGELIDKEENQRENYALRKSDDFVDTETSSKQLLFVQHIISMLKTGGTAAVVLPDNVLFEGGSGERVRRHLVQRCNLHTILRLPSGIFYAQGIKANVLFFTKMPASKQEIKTPRIWVYDYRAKIHHTLKTNPLKTSDLADFIHCYNPQNIEKRTPTYTNENPEGRFRCYEWSEIKDRSDLNFDFKWLKDDDDPYADVPLPELIEDYENQLDSLNQSFRALKEELSELIVVSR
jgi:type I restriction enzyme M protein